MQWLCVSRRHLKSLLLRAASKKSYEREQRARRQAEEERDQARKDLVPCEATILELRYTAAVQAGNVNVVKRYRRVTRAMYASGPGV
jgi:hypothetical protein